jgi:hypothetical protein
MARFSSAYDLRALSWANVRIWGAFLLCKSCFIRDIDLCGPIVTLLALRALRALSWAHVCILRAAGSCHTLGLASGRLSLQLLGAQGKLLVRDKLGLLGLASGRLNLQLLGALGKLLLRRLEIRIRVVDTTVKRSASRRSCSMRSNANSRFAFVLSSSARRALHIQRHGRLRNWLRSCIYRQESIITSKGAAHTAPPRRYRGRKSIFQNENGQNAFSKETNNGLAEHRDGRCRLQDRSRPRVYDLLGILGRGKSHNAPGVRK